MGTTLVTVGKYPNEAEAIVARALLESCGIASYLLRDDASGMEPGLTVAGGVRLAVSPRNVTRARRMLRSADEP